MENVIHKFRESVKELKYLNIYDSGFASAPVVTATTKGYFAVCPSVTVFYVSSSEVNIYTVEDSTADQLKVEGGQVQCRLVILKVVKYVKFS